jgi:thymidylate synthase ThyX
MRITQVAIRPTEASEAAGRPALTPELLAATGARYSRSGDGLDAILEKIDPANLDRSVDSIFKMIDYGHQSIADMAPVALFIDGISIWLAYHIWALCPTAGGQESSTRYIRFEPQTLLPADPLGIPESDVAHWRDLMAQCLAAFDTAYAAWLKLGETYPELTRIPEDLRSDPSGRAQKRLERMERNYAFDRARYLLPAALATNLMLVMSARGWTQLCQQLLSHPLPEAKTVGAAIRAELGLAAPRLLRHATETESIARGIQAELEARAAIAAAESESLLAPGAALFERSPTPILDIRLPSGASPSDLAADLRFHDNRYAWIGATMQRTMVRFGWEAVALAELRDLNRHRSGSKYSPLVPRGFYAAADQLPAGSALEPDLRRWSEPGRAASYEALVRLRRADPTSVYWMALGTQVAFEHCTAADRFIYEAELRTGLGAHFRYARHLHDALALWFERFPETRGLVIEGAAEPE